LRASGNFIVSFGQENILRKELIPVVFPWPGFAISLHVWIFSGIKQSFSDVLRLVNIHFREIESNLNDV